MDRITKIPKLGTKRRKVLNKLFTDRLVNEPTRWAEIKDVYDEGEPEDHGQLYCNPRAHSSMSVGTLLVNFADRVARGQYRLKDEWYRKLGEHINLPEEKPQVPMTCSCGTHFIKDEFNSITKGNEHHGFDWCKTGNNIAATLDLKEGSMVAIVKTIAAEQNIDADLAEKMAEAARLITLAQENLQDAAKNYTEVNKHFEDTLGQAQKQMEERRKR